MIIKYRNLCLLWVKIREIARGFAWQDLSEKCWDNCLQLWRLNIAIFHLDKRSWCWDTSLFWCYCILSKVVVPHYIESKHLLSGYTSISGILHPAQKSPEYVFSSQLIHCSFKVLCGMCLNVNYCNKMPGIRIWGTQFSDTHFPSSVVEELRMP